MATSKAATVSEYLKELPDSQRCGDVPEDANPLP